MDISGVATALSSSSSLGDGVSLNVLNSVNQLQASIGALLAASIGLGANVDQYA